jgi:hypothetical protein
MNSYTYDESELLQPAADMPGAVHGRRHSYSPAFREVAKSAMRLGTLCFIRHP